MNGMAPLDYSNANTHSSEAMDLLVQVYSDRLLTQRDEVRLAFPTLLRRQIFLCGGGK